MALNNRTMMYKWLFIPVDIKQKKQYWRWLSHGFIHADYMHLIVNMFTLFFFGPYLENYLVHKFNVIGIVSFVFFYLLSIVFSSIYSYYRNKNNYSYSALGASGAIAAVLFSYVILNPNGRLYIYAFLPIRAWLFGLLYLFYEYYMGKKQMDNIGHDAHFFGAVFGVIFIILIDPNNVVNFIEKLF